MAPNAADGQPAASAPVAAAAHEVSSEVTLELQQARSHGDAVEAVGRDENAPQLLVVRPKTVVDVDADGDLLVPRRRPRKRKTASLETHQRSNRATSGSAGGMEPDDMFVLEAQSCSTWEAAGTQLWRAALLLAEYVYARPELFTGCSVLELGCGIGFASIVASRFARCVFASDSDTDALRLAQRNAERNHHGELRFRRLNWETNAYLALNSDSPRDEFDWTTTDQDMMEALTTVIASDVFYDDTTTVAFLTALRGVMRRNPQVKAYVTLERRTVFSAMSMRVVSLGYDAFQEHICSHDPASCHTRVLMNQVRCRECTARVERACKVAASTSDSNRNDTDLLRFVVHQVPVGQIPQRFQYDRLSTLMIWVIDAVVAPYRYTKARAG